MFVRPRRQIRYVVESTRDLASYMHDTLAPNFLTSQRSVLCARCFVIILVANVFTFLNEFVLSIEASRVLVAFVVACGLRSRSEKCDMPCCSEFYVLCLLCRVVFGKLFDNKIIS